MDQLTLLLQRSHLFCNLSEEVIEKEIMPHGTLRSISKGQYLINFQERIDSFGIVISGKINTMHIYDNGNYGIMDTMGTGSIFAVDLVCTKSRTSPYYAVAVVPSQVLFFPASLLFCPGILTKQTRIQVQNSLLTFIADENIRKEYRLAILSQKGIRDRIMTFLTMQANKRATNTFTVPFNRDEMASYLCVNRTNLSHELSLME